MAATLEMPPPFHELEAEVMEEVWTQHMASADFYRPAYSREAYADLRAQAGVDSLVDQYGDVALGHLARQRAQLDPGRRRQLHRLARTT